MKDLSCSELAKIEEAIKLRRKAIELWQCLPSEARQWPEYCQLKEGR